MRVRASTKQYRPKGYWKDPMNLRTFFCHLAAELGFDALDPTNWTSVQVKEVLARQVRESLSKATHSHIDTFINRVTQYWLTMSIL